MSSSHMMSHTFSPSPIRPNLPLRRPATGPGLVNPSIPTSVFNDHGTRLPQERSLGVNSLDASNSEAIKNENDLVAARDSFARGPMAAPVTVKLCNYCSKQGNLRCTRCKKTSYCSVTCQTEDWKAHRHICKPSIPETCASNLKESQTLRSGDGPHVLESKMHISHVAQSKRVFMRDLRNNNITKGDEVQGSVVELKNPGKFFIHIQSVETSEILKNITRELQKTYGSSLIAGYRPEIGEICAVKFSFDQNWYRAEVVAVDMDHNTAKVLYIDFGNEEDVTLDKMRPLAANIDAAPPCALQCCLAGVVSVASSWTGECCVALRQLVAGKNLTFTVVDVISNSKILAVDASLSTLGKNLSTFLIEQGYAVKEDTCVKPQTKQDINSLMTASFENFKRLSGGKNENTEAQPPEPLSQGVGDVFTAVVTHLQSPFEIICQKLENASIIQQLQRGLREQCTRTRSSDNFRPAPGTVCCSLFSEDNQWYRAKVLAYSSEDRVCVGYIDFGNSEEVNLSHLRPISMDLLALATQAIPCALAGIKPNSDSWSEEVVVMLKQLVCNRFLRVEILGKRDGMALVSMIDESSDPQTNVAELLVATGCAAVGEMEQKEEAAEAPAIGAETVEKLEWSCSELPIDGQKVVLVISVLENPGEFYCYKYNAEDLHTLAKLSSALIKHCENSGTPFSPVVGDPCCALFSDGSWNRGIVQTVDGGGSAKVYFVDYGNTCEVEAAHLRAITPSLLKHPFQAVRCWLAGVEPVGGKWSMDAVHRFQALCVGKQLSGRVLSITERGYGVELECSGHSVASVLISEQLAVAIGHEIEPAAQASSPANLKEASPAHSVPTDTAALTDQPGNITGQKSAPLQSDSLTSFSLDWKTVELRCNETFQPQVVAVISPSLFYVMNPRKVNVDRLQTVMTDVARYCSRLAMPSKSIPLPGAACCAQFSGDKNWYRAVVLDTTSTQASVVYADYGNVESVPISSLLPISKELLQPPFQIARCALLGKENFSIAWPPEILELFSIKLSGKVLASVQGFDGIYNLLTMTELSGKGGSSINSVIVDALQKVTTRYSTEILTQEKQALTQGQMQADSIAMATGHNLSPDTEKSKPPHQQMENLETVTSVENEDPQSIPTSKGPTSCCCASLEQKITQVHELLLLLIKQIGGTQK